MIIKRNNTEHGDVKRKQLKHQNYTVNKNIKRKKEVQLTGHKFYHL